MNIIWKPSDSSNVFSQGTVDFTIETKQTLLLKLFHRQDIHTNGIGSVITIVAMLLI